MAKKKTPTFSKTIVFQFMVSVVVVKVFGFLNPPFLTAKAEKCEASLDWFDEAWYDDTQFAKDVNFYLINKTKMGDTKFINTKLNGKNVLEMTIPSCLIDSLLEYYKTYVEPFIKEDKYYEFGIPGHEFFGVSPTGWNSDIQWLSVDSISSYNHLLPYFEHMGLRDIFDSIIDADQKIVVYSIFFVIRSKIPTHKWHVDFTNTTNVNGFTLLTPLQKKSNIRLAYKDLNGNIQHYEYKKDVGIVFGENFSHATDLTRKDQNLEVLFCFSFGTDKLRDWPQLSKTASSQGRHYMSPRTGFYRNIAYDDVLSKS